MLVITFFISAEGCETPCAMCQAKKREMEMAIVKNMYYRWDFGIKHVE